MIKPQNRQKLLTVVAAVVMVFLVGDKLVLTPLTQSWKERQERIVQLTKDVSGGELLLGREQNVRSRWKAMQANALPDNTSVAEGSVFRAIDRWTRDSRINVSSRKGQWKQNEEDHMTLECTVDAIGNVQSLARFVYELERDPLALKIEDLQVSSRDIAGQQLSLNVRFTGLFLLAEQP